MRFANSTAKKSRVFCDIPGPIIIQLSDPVRVTFTDSKLHEQELLGVKFLSIGSYGLVSSGGDLIND